MSALDHKFAFIRRCGTAELGVRACLKAVECADLGPEWVVVAVRLGADQ